MKSNQNIKVLSKHVPALTQKLTNSLWEYKLNQEIKYLIHQVTTPIHISIRTLKASFVLR